MKTLITGTVTLLSVSSLIFVYPDSIGGLGGTFILVQLFTALILITCQIVTRFLKIGANELDGTFAYMVVILFLLGGINLIGFFEQRAGIDNPEIYHRIFIASMIFCTGVIYAYAMLTGKLFRGTDDIAQDDMKRYWKLQLTVNLAMFFIALPLSFLGIVQYRVALKHMPHSSIFGLEWFKMANIVLFFLIISFLVSLKYFIAFDPELVRKFASNREYRIRKYDLKLVRRYYPFSVAAVTVLGTGLEYSRGLWTTWFLTLALFVLMSLHFWRVFIGILPEQNSNTY